MKKEKRIPFYAFVGIGICIILISACKKNESNIDPFQYLSSTKKILTITNSSNGTNITYEYQTDGKLSKITYSDGYVNTFTYSGNTFTNIYQNGTASFSSVYKFNSKGYISSATGIDQFGSFSLTYEYDNAGYCRKATITSELSGSATYTYTYLNGNLVTEILNQNGKTLIWTYEYYLDKENTLGYGSPEPWNLTGKCNKNLMKKSSSIYGTFTYTYDYDSNNNIIKRTATQTDGTMIVTVTYSYYPILNSCIII